jgi:hypothetical protein
LKEIKVITIICKSLFLTIFLPFTFGVEKNRHLLKFVKENLPFSKKNISTEKLKGKHNGPPLELWQVWKNREVFLNRRDASRFRDLKTFLPGLGTLDKLKIYQKLQ